MFSNLVSYLRYSTPSAKTSQAENAPSDMRLRAVEEDEWVLVERNENEAGATKKDADEDTEMTRVTLAASTYPNSLPNSSKGLSRSTSLDMINPLQESWYLTPPPSFTSEGPVHMETSPLENLLIEHPSMSVYEHSQRSDASKKMSNSSPSGTTTSEEEHPVVLMAIKERTCKLPRNKLNIKCKKQSSINSPSSAGSVSPPVKEPVEAKEQKMKNFVKSPRRSIDSQLQSLPKKAPRRRPECSMTSEMISKTSTSNEEIPAVQNIKAKRLYSEVLASKPKIPAVQPSPESPSLESETSKTEPKPKSVNVISENSEDAATESASDENVMSIEENVNETESERPDDRDRRKVVPTLPDRQHRLHCLNRSAQKVEQRKTCDLIKKNPLIRTNKAREFNFRNKRQRRADMMQRHSGANNNRKCAKTSLY